MYYGIFVLVDNNDRHTFNSFLIIDLLVCCLILWHFIYKSVSILYFGSADRLEQQSNMNSGLYKGFESRMHYLLVIINVFCNDLVRSSWKVPS